MIEIKHLKLVQAVGELGSLKRAAERLCLTQSALSHQLRELENIIGAQVFHRTNNQLLFSPVGKELLEASNSILAQCEALEVRLKQISQEQMALYIHGYSMEETKRLNDQAKTIADLLHYDSLWPAGSLILEAGCGVGAQTKIISVKNPGCEFLSIDISEKSLSSAKQVVAEHSIDNVRLEKADVFQLPYPDNSFDHVFVCFLLEHISQPSRALLELKRVLKPGGTIMVIEGDHGSTYFHPDSTAARKAVDAQVTLQAKKGGNANIGREVSTLLAQSSFINVSASPRVVYVDDSKPEMMRGFIVDTFTAMIKGVADEAVSQSIISKDAMDEGIRDLLRTAQGGGSFSYTFFKARGMKAQER